MFRIAFLTEDRKLAEVLRSVAGRVHNMEVAPVQMTKQDAVTEVMPTVNRSTPKKPRAKRYSKDRTEITPQRLGFKTGDIVTAAKLVPELPKIGISKGSTWFATKRMLEEGTIRRVAAGQYEVVA